MRRILVLSVMLFVVVFLTGASNPAGQAVQRPINDFVSAQGTFCFPDGAGGCLLFVPPVENFLGWFDPSNPYAMSVDYAGLADDDDFGTEFSGKVTERPLPDGRAEVHVVLHTSNALTWVAEGDFNGPLLFGTRWDGGGNVAGEPTLGDSFLEVVFINTAPGDPLPDLIQLIFSPEPGQELKRIAFNANVKGPLWAAFGVPDGTPGRAIVVERGLFMTPFKGAVSDGFPVERIQLKVIGK